MGSSEVDKVMQVVGKRIEEETGTQIEKMMVFEGNSDRYVRERGKQEAKTKIWIVTFSKTTFASVGDYMTAFLEAGMPPFIEADLQGVWRADQSTFMSTTAEITLNKREDMNKIYSKQMVIQEILVGGKRGDFCSRTPFGDDKQTRFAFTQLSQIEDVEGYPAWRTKQEAEAREDREEQDRRMAKELEQTLEKAEKNTHELSKKKANVVAAKATEIKAEKQLKTHREAPPNFPDSIHKTTLLQIWEVLTNETHKQKEEKDPKPTEKNEERRSRAEVKQQRELRSLCRWAMEEENHTQQIWEVLANDTDKKKEERNPQPTEETHTQHNPKLKPTTPTIKINPKVTHNNNKGTLSRRKTQHGGGREGGCTDGTHCNGDRRTVRAQGPTTTHIRSKRHNNRSSIKDQTHNAGRRHNKRCRDRHGGTHTCNELSHVLWTEGMGGRSWKSQRRPQNADSKHAKAARHGGKENRTHKTADPGRSREPNSHPTTHHSQAESTEQDRRREAGDAGTRRKERTRSTAEGRVTNKGSYAQPGKRHRRGNEPKHTPTRGGRHRLRNGPNRRHIQRISSSRRPMQ